MRERHPTSNMTVEIIDSDGDDDLREVRANMGEPDIEVTGARESVAVDSESDNDVEIVDERAPDDVVIIGSRPATRRYITFHAPGEVYRVADDSYHQQQRRPFEQTRYPGSNVLRRPAQMFRITNSDARHRLNVRRVTESLLPFLRMGAIFNDGFGDDDDDYDSDEVPAAVMDAIRRSDEAADSRRISDRQKLANTWRKKNEGYYKISESAAKIYTREVSSDKEQMCVLCGVVLGEGIPPSFVPAKNQVLPSDVAEYFSKQKFRAPWRFSKELTTADRDLSKKIFFGRCGHVYCGRCVNNVNRSLPSKVEGKNPRKRRRTIKVDFENPGKLDFSDVGVYAPSTCPAEGCGKKTGTKLYFREIFI